MKNKIKRAISIVLTVVMILTVIPFAGFDFDELLSDKAGAIDFSNYSVGDIIEFGSYPQSKVVDTELISSLEDAGNSLHWVDYDYYAGSGDWRDGNMSPVDGMMFYKDILYNGCMYRAVQINQYRPYWTGKISSEADSYQDDNGYYTGNTYYFKYEPLTWRVLDPNEGYVVCTSAIDSQAYQNFIYYDNSNDEYYNSESCTNYATDWATSSLREWLNSDFYNTAFSDEEKVLIKDTYNENKSTYGNDYDSINTFDKVFPLSYSDVLNTSYGFDSDYSSLDTARQIYSTDYAQCQGCHKSVSTTHPDFAWVWLRSPYRSYRAAYIYQNGYVYNYYLYDYVSSVDFGVVPALKLNNNMENNPDSSFAVGDIVEIGTYPQSKVTDETIISALDNIEKNWISYGYYSGTGTYADGEMTAKDYMKYCDISYDGEKYRAVNFDSYRPNSSSGKNSEKFSYQDENGYFVKTTYYFRFEPLKWRILDTTAGLVVSTKALSGDTFQNYIKVKTMNFCTGYYNAPTVPHEYVSNWSTSSIRTWLEIFYDEAFSDSEKGEIVTTINENKSTGGGAFSCVDTTDKIFFLSYNDAKNEDYGFSSATEASATRVVSATEYAKCQGCYVNDNDTCSWYLRTPNDSESVGCCESNGTLRLGLTVGSVRGIVPAMRFNINSLKSDYDYSDKAKTGDIIEFGSYPQTEVTDENIISALNNLDKAWLSYGYYVGTGQADGNMQSSDFMKYCDLSYNGEKYRAVCFNSNRPCFTSYPPSESSYQFDNGYIANKIYYFKFEPLKWRVLAPYKGYVMCDKAIDAQAFNNYVLKESEQYYGNAEKTCCPSDWANSSLRLWLNNDFYNLAFNDYEKSKIYTTNLKNNGKTADGEQTNDKIFIPSYADIKNPIYGFSPLYSDYDYARMLVATDYTKCQGTYVERKTNKCGWWIRYQYTTSTLLYVCSNGQTSERESSWLCGIVPAITIDLDNLNSEHTCTYEESVIKQPTCTEEGTKQFTCSICGDSYTEAIPAIGHDWSGWTVDNSNGYTSEKIRYCTKCGETETAALSVGDIIEFGSYPQSEVTDETLISSLDAIEKEWVSYRYYMGGTGYWGDGNFSSSDYMKYCDISYDGNRYRAVIFSSYRPYWVVLENDGGPALSYQDENGFFVNNVYYFKYEPLVWKVLDPAEGYVMCTNAIDAQPYSYFAIISNDEYYSNKSLENYASDWSTSYLRDWLNGQFFNTAFSSYEKQQIPKAYNENKSFANSDYDGINTYDNIFVPSYEDVLNPNFGFNSSYSDYDNAKQIKSTDYALCQGCYNPTQFGYDRETIWWHRTAEDSLDVSVSFYDGSLHKKNAVFDGGNGVVPAFKFNPQATECNHSYNSEITVQPTCSTEGIRQYTCTICGDSYTESIPALGHSYTETVIPPTCTEGGYTVHVCERCTDSYTDNQTEPTGHHYTDTVVAPTCDAEGYTVHTCPDCGDSYVDSYTEASGHVYVDTVVPATCKEGGYTVHTCKTCGDYYVDSYTEATGCHYVDTVVAPTCKERGYTIHSCPDCGDTYIDSYTDTVPHKFTSVTINPTCVNEGYTLNTCDDCGFASITNKIPAIGHDYIEMVVDPTCEKEGYTTHMCTRGDHYYIDNRIPALGHSYDKTVIQATCIQDGCTLNICTKCGKVSKSDVIPASGHNFGSWMTVEYATEEHEGLQQRHCQNCGYCEDKIIPIVNRTTFNVTFKADGKTVAVVEYVKGSDSIEEPPVPHKDRFTGKWEEYSLNDSDITVNAVYTVISSDDLSGVDSGESARYDANTGIATINLYAASQGKTIVSTSNKAVPLDIILVVDQSGSMDDRLGSGISKKQALINSANAFVNSVYADATEYNVDHRIAIVGFGMGNISSGIAYPAYLNTEILTTGGSPVQMNKAKAADYANALMYVNNNGSLNANITRAINSIDANGATAADFGLAMANNIYANNPDESGERQRIVVFMTDGAPTYSNDFSKDVANAAILQAYALKNTYGAYVYSIGVMSDSNAKENNINKFMNSVSSNHIDAKSLSNNGNPSATTYYQNVTNTNALSGVFTKIVAENVTRTTDFDNVTMISTVSKYFTLTSQQEKELRINAIEEYGVTNDDITVTRNDDGTTTVIIKGMHPVDDGSQFVIDFNYHVSANENAAEAGSYPVGTDDAGIMLGDAENYEATFTVPYVTVPTNRGTAVFTVNGEIYTIKTVLDGKAPTAPETDFEGQYQFSGWTIAANSMANGYAVYDATLATQEYVVIWNTSEGTQKVAYNPGDVITEPEVAENDNGDAFRRWNGEVPTVMPDHSIEFTAVYGDHEHKYNAETVVEMTCLTDGTVKYTCEICGDTYTETVTCPGHHTWKAITGPADKDNHSTAAFECECCGLCADNTLDYVITDNEANERGHYNSITHEFNYLDDNGTAHQPNGLLTIISNINEYFGDADGVNVYRIDDNGNRIKCESEYDNGVLSFETNHFSTYVYEPVYECQITGNHIDANDDGYCDRCDSVLEEFIDFILKSGIDAQIDRDYRILMGNDVLSYSSDSVAGMFEFGNIYVEGKDNGKIGTGDIICLTNSDGVVCSRLTAVIFGDVNGDGWYDGMDSMIVSCIANGMLSEDDVGEAVYMAADCNHDGVIDQLDVDILNQAGVLLSEVDQTKSEEELLETSSAYVQYLNLIQQSPETETTAEEVVEDTPTDAKEPVSINWFEMIVSFLKMLLNFVYGLFTL